METDTLNTPVYVPSGQRLQKITNGNHLVKISGGSFIMGNVSDAGYSQERPCFEVRLDDFYISKYCVTAGSFLEFIEDLGKAFNDSWIFCINPCFIYKHINKYRLAVDAADFPMTNLSYEGALAYCNWLSEKEGLEPVYDLQSLAAGFSRSGFRLPTEAEWEFACKGEAGYAYSFGNTFESDRINSKEYNGPQAGKLASSKKTGGFGLYSYSPVKVGSLPANPNGLHEMLGNVHEWCHDKYAPYTPGAKTNPTADEVENSSFRVIRGAAFNSDMNLLRSTYRHAFHYKAKCYSLGFRIAKNKLI